MGYARTKSLPSIIAGCTVGLLCKSNEPFVWRVEQRLTVDDRRTWWISHAEPRAVWSRTEPSCFCHSWRLVNPKGHPVAKARSRGSQYPGHHRGSDLW